MPGKLRTESINPLRKTALAISIVTCLGSSLTHAKESVADFPSLDDGALIPYRDTDRSVKTFYVDDAKVEKSIGPAVDLFCEPYLAQGIQCSLIDTRRERLFYREGDTSSYTRLYASLQLTKPGEPIRSEVSTLDVRILRSCPTGSVLVNDAGQHMANLDPVTGISYNACRQLQAGPTEKALGEPTDSVGNVCPTPTGPLVGNPINPATLSKIEVVTDIQAPADSDLSFVRTYHSGAFPLQSSFPNNAVVYTEPGLIGARWRHNFDRRIVSRRGYDHAAQKYVDTVHLVTEDGREVRFMPTLGGYASELDNHDQLKISGSGWTYRLANGSEEQYDEMGYIVSRRNPSGRTLTFSYRDGLLSGLKQLTTVMDWQSRRLELDYDDAGRLSAVTGADGARTTYDYDESLGQGLGADLSIVTYPDGRAVRYLYDEPDMGGTPSHKLTGVVREDGVRYATFRYDDKNRAIGSEHGDGLETTMLSTGADGVIRVTLDGPEEEMDFQSIYGVPRIISRSERFDLKKIRSETTYYPDGRIASLGDYKGVKTTYAYSKDSRMENEKIEAAQTPVQRKSRTTWHPRFDLPTKIDHGSSWTTYAYDDYARLVERVDGGISEANGSPSADTPSRTTRYAYGADGQIESIDGPVKGSSDVVRFTYHDQDAPGCSEPRGLCPWRKGDLQSIVDATGLATRFDAYDGAGRLLTSRDPNGVLTERSYDARGRHTRTVIHARADGATSSDDVVESTYYNANGQPERRTDADGASITFAYDEAHRLIATRDALGRNHTWTLNGLGRPIEEIHSDANDVAERLVQREFDSHGRMTRETSADLEHRFEYDENGRLVKRQTGIPNEVYSLDALGRTIDIAYSPGHMSASVNLAYGSLNDIQSVRDPKDLATSYQRNGFGDVLIRKSPDTKTLAIEHDEVGRIVRRIDSDGRERRAAYDASNRLVDVSYGDGQAEHYVYDVAPDSCPVEGRYAKGRLASVTYPDGVTSFCYDFVGRVTQKTQTTQGVTLSIGYAYTPAGRLSSLTLPDGTVASYHRNAAGEVDRIDRSTPSGNTVKLAEDLRWTSFGKLGEWTAGARRTTRKFDLYGRVVSQTERSAGGLTYDLSWNTNGFISQIATPSDRLSIHYDLMGRITGDSAGLGFSQYTYDNTGDRISRQGLTPTSFGFDQSTYRYASDSHRLLAINGYVREYDASGNTTKIGDHEFVYDSRNRMVQAKVSGVVEMNYAYSPFGQQIARHIAGQAVVSLHDESGHWLGDYDGSGQPIRQIVWLDDQPMAVIEGTSIRDIQSDHLGTPRVLIDRASNKPIWNWSITGDSFGNHAPNEDPDSDGKSYIFDMRFPGQRYDSVTKLFQNVWRDYDPTTGRYIQSDPIGLAGGISTYVYAGSNPHMQIDSMGLRAKCKCLGDGQAKININLEFKGEGATPEVVAAMRSSIEQTWSTTGFEVTTSIGGWRASKINVPTGKGRSFVQGNAGVWYAGEDPWVSAHEAGHLMRLDDRYTETSPEVTVPAPGWEGTIMAEHMGMATPADRKGILTAFGCK